MQSCVLLGGCYGDFGDELVMKVVMSTWLEDTRTNFRRRRVLSSTLRMSRAVMAWEQRLTVVPVVVKRWPVVVNRLSHLLRVT